SMPGADPLLPRERHRGGEDLAGLVELDLEIHPHRIAGQLDLGADADVVAAAVPLPLHQVEADPVAGLAADRFSLETGIGAHHREVAPGLVVEGDGAADAEV